PIYRYILYIYISYDHISTECITDIYYFLLFPGYYSLSVHIVTVHNGEVMSVMDKVPLKPIDVLQFLHILRYGKAACGGVCLGNIPQCVAGLELNALVVSICMFCFRAVLRLYKPHASDCEYAAEDCEKDGRCDQNKLFAVYYFSSLACCM